MRISNLIEKFEARRDRGLVARHARHDDIYLVEFPKSGVTWLCFILANLMKQKNRLSTNINFFNVHDFVPDIHASRNISESIPTLAGVRIIKSHAYVNRHYKKIIYLWRDPREVMRSYYRFQVSLGQFQGTYNAFVRDVRFGVSAWAEHVNGWLTKSDQATRMIFVEYGALKRQTKSTVSELLDGLGAPFGDAEIERAVENSAYQRMQELEERWSQLDARRRNSTIFDKKFRFVGNDMDIQGDEDDYVMDKCSNLLKLLK